MKKPAAKAQSVAKVATGRKVSAPMAKASAQPRTGAYSPLPAADESQRANFSKAEAVASYGQARAKAHAEMAKCESSKG
ncbi:hypothetical protein [Pseudidiomarina halophila]